MKLATALEQTSLSRATVVAGRQALDRDLVWVHIVDHPDIFNWLKKGDLLLTGQLGDVMRESAHAGMSYIRSRAAKLKLLQTCWVVRSA